MLAISAEPGRRRADVGFVHEQPGQLRSNPFPSASVRRTGRLADHRHRTGRRAKMDGSFRSRRLWLVRSEIESHPDPSPVLTYSTCRNPDIIQNRKLLHK